MLEAQDRASQQLRQVGQDVQRLERQVEGATRSTRGLSAVFGQLRQGISLGAGIGAIQAGVAGLGRVWDLLSDSIVGANSRLEQQRGALRALTGSASEAERILTQLRREADVTPFDTEEMIQAGAALTAVARNAQTDLMDLVRTAEILAAFQPTQGLEGAAVAIREAFEGNFQSLTERFGVTGAAIRRFQAQGLSTFAAINAAMAEMGLNSRLIQELANTFPGLTSNVVSFFNEFRRRLGEGVFLRLEDGLRAITTAIAQNGEAVLAWASRVGSMVGALVGRVGGMLGELAVRFLNWLDPGTGDRAREIFSGVTDAVAETGAAAERAAPQLQRLDRALSLPEAQRGLEAAQGSVEALRSLAAQTNAPVEALARELGRVGVAAGELQLEANRVRESYDRQLAPLERQLRLLQQSADLQRVQNALAGNRGAVERLRLEREIAVLQRAAGGATDPGTAGLSLRQRLIALALQERNLRLEELDLTEQQRPAVQSLEQQIAAIQEQQRATLAPLEAQLAAYRDQADVLQLQRQRWEVLRGEIQATVDLVAANPIQPHMAGPDDGEVARRQEEYRQAGEAMADRFLKGWDEKLKTQAKATWQKISDSYKEWYDGGGKKDIDQYSADIGTAVGTNIGDAVEASLKQRLAGLGQVMEFLKTVLGPALGGPAGPAGATAVGALPQVAGEVAKVGTQGVTVNFGPLPVSITMGGLDDPGFGERLKAALTDFLRNFVAAEAATAPGASNRLQGAGRAP